MLSTGVSLNVIGFNWQADHSELIVFIRKSFLQMVKPSGKIVVTAGQFAQCLALNEALKLFMSCFDRQ